FHIPFVDWLSAHINQSKHRKMLVTGQRAKEIAKNCTYETANADLFFYQPMCQSAEPFFSNIERVERCAVEQCKKDFPHTPYDITGKCKRQSVMQANLKGVGMSSDLVQGATVVLNNTLWPSC